MDTPNQRRIRLFYSYAHDDEELRDELEEHLTLLKRQRIIDSWHDRRIVAGEERADAVNQNLEKADVILLLVSASFIGSDYCWNEEMTRAMDRHEAREAVVIPVIIRDVNWNSSPFGKLQALPTDGKSVDTWSNRDSAWRNVSEGIERAIQRLTSDSGSSANSQLQVADAQLPTPFHINFPKNARFQGRETELAALNELLQSSGTVGINSAKTAGVTGMGGIGKTQLAVEYAYRHRPDYPGGIFLLNAAEEVLPQLVDVARLLNLRVSDPERADINDQLLTALRDYLQQHSKTLLIFDNVEDPDLLLRRKFGPLTLPALGGTLLITNRTRQLPESMKSFSLDTLENDPDAAKAIITNARPDLANDVNLNELCERMGYLPLGLNLAASVLRDISNLPIADYLTELEQLGLYDLTTEADVGKPDDYAYAGLTPVLQHQWEQLQRDEQSADACTFFQICGQLGEAAFIPIARLSLLANVRDSSRVRRPLTKALERLENLYFIERLEEEAIRLHPLVRDFAEGCVSEEERAGFRNQ